MENIKVELLAADVNLAELDIREKADIVSLFYARLDSKDERYKGKCFKVLAEVAGKYGYKVSLLKNDKDAFDNFFDNGRRGWQYQLLEKRSKFLQIVFDKYKDMSIDEHEKLVNRILVEVRSTGETFFSIKTKNPSQVTAILNKESNIEIDGLNILKNELTLDQLVFIVLGGDKPAWETGLIGMGVISKLPYDEGYEGRNYKIRIDVKVLLDKPIKRDDLVTYKDTYDIIGIGPITKWEPNQAISQVNEKKAVALMRAMLELCPGIEEDLSSIIDEQLMTRVKGSTVKLVPQEVDFGEDVKTDLEIDEEEIEQRFDDFVEIYNPDIEVILEGFSMTDKPIISLKNFVNSRKHIIMTGPPGTGKTTLAERACEEAVNKKFITDYMMTTAVADWSTFDTIGGYMPDKNGRLVFQEGVFLKSIRENKWLIVDEINRAEVDKAFGHFFTVLSGKSVELQFKTQIDSGEERNISIVHSDTLCSYYDSKSATYYIGRNWRIIATMNTYDKNSLFMLSYAFMRRFAFVYIPTPNEQDFEHLIVNRLGNNKDIAKTLIGIIKSSPRKMGAAIIIDLISYLESSDYTNLVDGISSLIIPQYEGISLSQIKEIYRDFGSLFNGEEKEIFKNYLCEFFDVKSSELEKVKFTDDNDEDEIEEDE